MGHIKEFDSRRGSAAAQIITAHAYTIALVWTISRTAVYFTFIVLGGGFRALTNFRFGCGGTCAEPQTDYAKYRKRITASEA